MEDAVWFLFSGATSSKTSLLCKITTSTSCELLMPLQLSIFSFVRSKEMLDFFCKCIWSLVLLTFRGFSKGNSDSPLNSDFFKHPAEKQQQRTKIESVQV